MMSNPEIIAERRMKIGDDNLVLEIHKPYFDVEWRCPHLIRMPNGRMKGRTLAGEDALESLLLSIKVAEQFLNSFAEMEESPISWNGRSDIALTIRFDDT